MAELEEIRCLAKIAIDQLLDPQVIMPVTFLQITEKPWEAAGPERFKLLLHGFHIGGQRQLAAVIKDQVIGGVDALQFEEVTHRGPQLGELGLI